MRDRLLIIDDDARNVFALSAVLRAKNYICDTASGALEGIEKMRHGNYDFVLMDMMMPEMDGYEAIERIQSDTMLKKIPVICITAQAMPGDKEKCLATGASGYIPKPVVVDKLINLMDKIKNRDA